MSVQSKIAAKLAAATRYLTGFATRAHIKSLERVKVAANAEAKAAFVARDKQWAVENAVKVYWDDARKERIRLTAAAVQQTRETGYTISAADGEIGRYNV